MSHHRTKFEPDGSITTWESEDGRSWRMTGQTYPAPVPECDCLARPFKDGDPLHVPGCPRMAAIRVKYGRAA